MWTDEKVLQLNIWDSLGKLLTLRVKKLVKKDPTLKEYLIHRYSYWNNSYSDVIRLIKKGFKEWPTCPTCGKFIKNIIHKHCSTKCSTLDPQVKEKQENTMLDRHGVKNGFNIPEVKEKAQIAYKKVLEKEGITCVFQRKEVVEAANTTRKEKAENNPNYWKDIKDKEKNTRQQKLIEDPDYYKKIKDKEIITKKQNNSLNSSSQEDSIYNKLVNKYGKDDIIREYTSNKYPFHCDFYIKSRNLYIECNFHWTHGNHWYDSLSNEDKQQIEAWKAKNDKFYNVGIDVWTRRDVEKRNKAKENNLNYIVFWTTVDYDFWENFNYPDGKDYEIEYSWLPIRKISCCISKPITNSVNKIINFYQFNEKYKNELNYWNNASIIQQVDLYKNRFKYINKLPKDLTNSEIIYGLKVSYKTKWFSSFDNSQFIKLLTNYNIKSVYDFCAGWGERLLTCYNLNIKYEGIDINNNLLNGYINLIKDFNIKEQTFNIGDSSIYLPNNKVDLVFTCPPYFNQEIYSTVGAENLNNTDFIQWWEKSVTNALTSNPKYFAYQINQKNKDELNKILIKLNLEKINQLDFNIKANHVNKNNKIDYESIEIFKNNNYKEN